MKDATKETLAQYRAKLQTHKTNMNRHYATFRDLSKILVQRALVRYNTETHRFTDAICFAGRSVSWKERQTVAMFITLQKNIEAQAVLILELEHAINQEENKCQSEGAPGQEK